MTDRRLSTHDVATFAACGVLVLPGVVPAEINLAAIDECRQILSTWGTPDRQNAPTSGQTADPAVDLDWYLTRRASRDAIDRAAERGRT